MFSRVNSSYGREKNQLKGKRQCVCLYIFFSAIRVCVLQVSFFFSLFFVFSIAIALFKWVSFLPIHMCFARMKLILMYNFWLLLIHSGLLFFLEEWKLCVTLTLKWYNRNVGEINQVREMKWICLKSYVMQKLVTMHQVINQLMEVLTLMFIS